jgi:hypothetical protein
VSFGAAEAIMSPINRSPRPITKPMEEAIESLRLTGKINRLTS